MLTNRHKTFTEEVNVLCTKVKLHLHMAFILNSVWRGSRSILKCYNKSWLKTNITRTTTSYWNTIFNQMNMKPTRRFLLQLQQRFFCMKILIWWRYQISLIAVYLICNNSWLKGVVLNFICISSQFIFSIYKINVFIITI